MVEKIKEQALETRFLELRMKLENLCEEMKKKYPKIYGFHYNNNEYTYCFKKEVIEAYNFIWLSLSKSKKELSLAVYDKEKINKNDKKTIESKEDFDKYICKLIKNNKTFNNLQLQLIAAQLLDKGLTFEKAAHLIELNIAAAPGLKRILNEEKNNKIKIKNEEITTVINTMINIMSDIQVMGLINCNHLKDIENIGIGLDKIFYKTGKSVSIIRKLIEEGDLDIQEPAIKSLTYYMNVLGKKYVNLRYYVITDKTDNEIIGAVEMLINKRLGDYALYTIGPWEKKFYYWEEVGRIKRQLLDVDQMKLTLPKNYMDKKMYDDIYVDFAKKIEENTIKIMGDILTGRDESTKKNGEVFKLRMFENLTYDDIAVKIAEKFKDNKVVTRERIRQRLNSCKKVLNAKKINGDSNPLRQEYLKVLENIPRENFLNMLYWGIQENCNKQFLDFILEVVDNDYHKNELKKPIQLLIKDKINAELDKLSKQIIENQKNYQKTEILLQNITKPKEKKHEKLEDAIKDFEKLEPRRKTSDKNNNGTIIFKLNGKKKKIEYESFLEKNIIETIILKAIKGSGIVSDIKTQSVEIEYKYNGKKYKYYPDLALLLADGLIVLIEVKPKIYMYDHRVLAKYEAMKDYCNKYSYGYAMIDGSFKSFENIIVNAGKKANQDEVCKFVKFIRDKGKINFNVFNDYKIENNIGINETMTAVMNNEDIEFSQKKPFEFRCNKKILK